MDLSFTIQDINTKEFYTIERYPGEHFEGLIEKGQLDLTSPEEISAGPFRVVSINKTSIFDDPREYHDSFA